MKVVLKLALLLLCSATAILPCSNAFAQRELQDRAAVVVAVESVDDLLGDVSYLVGAAGFPEFVPLVTFGATEFVRGLDKAQPAGALVTFNDQTPVIVGFIPVTDMEQVLDTLSNQSFDVEEDGDFHLLSTPTGDNIVVLEQDGWAFVSDSKDNLENLPQDPAAIIGEMTAKYSISAKAFVQRIPQELRDQAIGAMREGFEDAMGNAGEDDLAGFQKKYNELSINNLVEMIEDSESIMVGFEIDSEGKRTYFDFELVARPETKLARRIAATGSVKSTMLGFLRENAAVNFHMCTGMIEEDKATYVDLLQEGRQEMIDAISGEADDLSDDERQVIEKTLGSLIDVGIATVKAGKFDMAGSLVLEDGKFSMIGGAAVADGQQLSEPLLEMLELAAAKIKEEEDREIVITPNAAQHEGITFHTMSTALSDDDDEIVRKIFGDQPMSAIGVSDDGIYLAVSPTAIEDIKAAVAGQGDDGGVAVGGVINVMPILKFATGVSDDDQADAIMTAMIDSLEETGKDRILLQATYEGNTASSRLEIEEGLIRLIGVGVQQFQAAAMGAGGEDF